MAKQRLQGRSPWNNVTRVGLITILGKLNAIVNCRVPMADVHFGYPMDPWVHTGTLVFLSLRANEHRGGDFREIALQERVWSQYWASWTPEHRAQRGRSPRNSVKRSGLITILGKLNAIVNCRVPMADVHFRVPYGLMSPHRYFGVPES